MAVITIQKDDLDDLVGKELSEEALSTDCSMLGVLFEPNGDGTVDVEVEPNRPDLLSVEGLARTLRGFCGIEAGAVEYPIHDGDTVVSADDSVADVRPYIACARIKDISLSEDSLDSIIQLQEKLTETYGRRRAKVAIGLHDTADLTDDITYTAVSGDYSFEPLGWSRELSIAEILEQHEKGKAYGWIVDDADAYPLIVDSDDTVLSFPPVINGTATEVTADTTDIFLDVTGTSRREVETALNILVAALHERGGTIETVEIDGETYPEMAGEEHTLAAEYVRDITGLDLSAEEMAKELGTMRYDAAADDGTLTVTIPAYRADIMHDYDVIEDIAIGYGYGNISAEIPDVATIGSQTPGRVFTDKLRELMIGAGAQECMTFILSNTNKLFDRMDLDTQAIVSMANPLTEDYAVVRNWMLPSLMEVLAGNQHHRYPQTLFEAGTVSQFDTKATTGARDGRKLAYIHAADGAGFDTARGVVQTLATSLGADLEITENAHPSFAEKRCGQVQLNGEPVGVIGEVSEDVLENWGLDVDVVAFELDVETVQDATQ